MKSENVFHAISFGHYPGEIVNTLGRQVIMDPWSGKLVLIWKGADPKVRSCT